MLSRAVAFLALGAVLLFSGCAEAGQGAGLSTDIASDGGSAASETPPDLPLSAKAASVKANETGKIMVLMYHVIGEKQEASWVQTAENFRRDLRTLYEQGYALIRLADLVDDRITAPAGRTPVVLTFDDGSEGHFRYLIDREGRKEIDPDCAVGILLEFGRNHPDFGHTATFFINNDPPFRQGAFWREKLCHLVELGFDIGNHTLTHAKLNKITAEEVQKELAGLARLVEETVPAYRVRALALPYGLLPAEPGLAARGSHDGYSYAHDAVLKVGANPAPSPSVKSFDPYRLPRVQASTAELSKWLEYFKKNPQERYISDGDPLTVAVPQDREDLLDTARLGEKKW